AVPIAFLAAEAVWAAGSLFSGAGRAAIASMIVLAVAAAPMFALDYRILTEPTTAPISEVIRHAFINTWAAGYGEREVTAFLRKEAASSRAGIRVVIWGVGDGVNNGLVYEL